MMMHNPLNQPHLLQRPHRLARDGTVDLHTLDEDRLGDHLVGGDFFEDLVAA